MRQIALSMTSAFLILLLTAVADAADVKLDVPDDVIFEKGIEYTNAGEEHLALDLARPKTPQGLSAAILCIHGGGFRAGKREHHDQLCIRLAQGGYVAATVTYRLAPKHQFPAAVHDVKAAVRWLRANAAKYGIDPERIGATGDSAGGHLALMLGLTGDVKSLDGKEGGNLEQSSRVSCVVDRLRAAEVEAELLSMEGAGHGFKGEDAKRAHDAMLVFFDKHLKPR